MEDDKLTLDDILGAVPVNSRDYRRYKARYNTRRAVLRDMDVQPGEIDALERALRRSPTPMTNARIAGALGVSENRAHAIVSAATFLLPLYDEPHKGVALLGVHDR